MKKELLYLVCSFLFLLSTISHSHTITSSARTSLLPGNEDPNTIYESKKCKYRIHDLYGGIFGESVYISPIRSKDKPDEPIVWGFGLACHAGATGDEIDDLLGARKLKDQWFWTGTNAPFEANQYFRLIEFSGKNWTGIGNTNDQITGEETLRQRFFNFCLFQTGGSQVLCVCNLQVMNLNHPNSNILEKVIDILKSIEFVEPDAPAMEKSRYRPK